MILLGYGLFFLHFDQVGHFTHHAENLRRGFVLHRVVHFFDAQSLNRQLLTLGAVDGAAHLSDYNLSHRDYPLNTRWTEMPRTSATSAALRILVNARNVAFTTL